MARFLRVAPLCVGVIIVSVFSCFPRYAVAGRHCPRCSAHCELSVEEGERSRHCWQIDCEEVCVPKVVFPWQNHRLFQSRRAGCAETGCTGAGCTGVRCTSCTAGDCCGHVKHNGAFVIKVRKLKKHKYTCPKCEYTWEVKKPGCADCSESVEETTEESPGGDAEDESAAGDEEDQAAASDAGADDSSTEDIAPEDYLPETPPEPEALPPNGPSLNSPQSTAIRIPKWEQGVHRYRQLQERPIVFEITDLPRRPANNVSSRSIRPGSKEE